MENLKAGSIKCGLTNRQLALNKIAELLFEPGEVVLTNHAFGQVIMFDPYDMQYVVNAYFRCNECGTPTRVSCHFTNWNQLGIYKIPPTHEYYGKDLNTIIEIEHKYNSDVQRTL